MTERQIQRAIWIQGRSRFEVLLPNYTPRGWFECDLFAVTRAGYFHEFEVKISVSDFRADADKCLDKFAIIEGRWMPSPGRRKHDLLAGHIGTGPSRFWYVLPDGLVAAAEVPDWAGIHHVMSRHGSIWLTTVRPAPRLHSQRARPEIVRHALGVCYHRYWRERMRLDAAREALRAGSPT